MRTVELSICALLLAAGGGWAIWLTTGYRSNDLAAAGLALAAAASLAAYYASDRKRWSGRPSRRHRDVPCWQWC